MDKSDFQNTMMRLETALSGLNPDLLHARDQANIELGSVLRQYAGPPSVADPQDRSSIREDTVVRELARLLADHPNDEIRVLDACCGEAALASRMLSSLTEEMVGRIHFCGVDQDPACISTLVARIEEFDQFCNCRFMQRQVWDLADLGEGRVDFVVVSNAIHEIYPHLYPSLFAMLNRLLHPTRGRICIVDMEVLPTNEPEAYAINWSGPEMARILEAGRFVIEITRHPKATTVYQAHIRRAESIDEVGMREMITRVLREKLLTVAKARRRLDTRVRSDNESLKTWLILTGTLARIADELLVLSGECIPL